MQTNWFSIFLISAFSPWLAISTLQDCLDSKSPLIQCQCKAGRLKIKLLDNESKEYGRKFERPNARGLQGILDHSPPWIETFIYNASVATDLAIKKVMEYGCGSAINALQIQNTLPNSEVHAVNVKNVGHSGQAESGDDMLISARVNNIPVVCNSANQTAKLPLIHFVDTMLPFPDDYFDFIISQEVVKSLGKLKANDAHLLVPYFARFLQPGGIAVLQIDSLMYLFNGLNTNKFTPLHLINADIAPSTPTYGKFSILLYIRNSHFGVYIRRCCEYGFGAHHFDCLFPPNVNRDLFDIKFDVDFMSRYPTFNDEYASTLNLIDLCHGDAQNKYPTASQPSLRSRKLTSTLNVTHNCMKPEGSQSNDAVKNHATDVLDYFTALHKWFDDAQSNPTVLKVVKERVRRYVKRGRDKNKLEAKGQSASDSIATIER